MALLTYVLLGMSPRLFSICLNSGIGKIVPSFSALSMLVLLTIPIYLNTLSYKGFLPYVTSQQIHTVLDICTMLMYIINNITVINQTIKN